jgi:hypothetical protein
MAPHRAPLLPVLLVLSLAACEDAPTAPSSYAQVLGGVTWVAVVEPDGMARAESWIPGAAPAAAAEARRLLGAAARARRAGDPLAAAELEERAMLVAAAAPRPGDAAERVRVPLGALNAWIARAHDRLRDAPHPELERTTAEVTLRAAAARDALDAGDPSRALLEVGHATAAARRHAPAAVGARLLAALEDRLAAAPAGTATERARRLHAGAREGLLTGENVRALRRVVYAHQLLDAAAIR